MCGSESTGEPSRCDQPVACGDGLVVPGEGCDDANADDADGCAADCRRPEPRLVAMLDFPNIHSGVVERDGSVVVLSGDGRVARFAADGSELWRQPLAEDETHVYPRAVLVGEQIIVLGALGEEGATQWRFTRDGAPVAVESFPEHRSFERGALASDGGVVVLTDERVIRLAVDGTELWSQIVAGTLMVSVHGLALANDDVAFLPARYFEQPAAILRATPRDVVGTYLEYPEFANPYLHAMAPMPDGGAVAVGYEDDHALVVRVDANNQIIWTSACSSGEIGALPGSIAVIEDRIVIAGSHSADPSCDYACPRMRVVWIQHLSFDGSVVATDDPGSVFGAAMPDEHAAVIGGGPARGITMLAAGSDGLAMMRFPW